MGSTVDELARDLGRALESRSESDVRYALDDLYAAASKVSSSQARLGIGTRGLHSALTGWILHPEGGGEGDPVCAALYRWTQARVALAGKKKKKGGGGGSQRGAALLFEAVVVPLLPLLVARYLGAWKDHVVLSGLEAVLLAVHNMEAVSEGNTSSTLTLPVLSRPSVFHDPGVLSETRDGEGEAGEGEQGGRRGGGKADSVFPVAIELPLRTTGETTWGAMSVVLATCLAVFNDALEGGQLGPHVLVQFCGIIGTIASGPVTSGQADPDAGRLAFPAPAREGSGGGGGGGRGGGGGSGSSFSDSSWSGDDEDESDGSDDDAFYDAPDAISDLVFPANSSGTHVGSRGGGNGGRVGGGGHRVPLKLSMQMHDKVVSALQSILQAQLPQMPSLMGPAVSAAEELHARAVRDLDAPRLVSTLALVSIAHEAKVSVPAADTKLRAGAGAGAGAGASTAATDSKRKSRRKSSRRSRRR